MGLTTAFSSSPVCLYTAHMGLTHACLTFFGGEPAPHSGLQYVLQRIYNTVFSQRVRLYGDILVTHQRKMDRSCPCGRGAISRILLHTVKIFHWLTLALIIVGLGSKIPCILRRAGITNRLQVTTADTGLPRKRHMTTLGSVWGK